MELVAETKNSLLFIKFEERLGEDLCTTLVYIRPDPRRV